MDSSAHNLLKILMNDMDCVNEQFKANLERCEMPPFYRFQNILETTHEKQVAAKMKETTACTAEMEQTSPLKVFVLFFCILEYTYGFVLKSDRTFAEI